MTNHREDEIPHLQDNDERLFATELSSRPERTRISCHAAPDMTTYAAFIEESRMKLASATNLYRKSGVAQWRDLRFPFSSTSSFSRRGRILTSAGFWRLPTIVGRAVLEEKGILAVRARRIRRIGLPEDFPRA
jgi:hypothetical protein